MSSLNKKYFLHRIIRRHQMLFWRAQSLTSLKADICQDINWGLAFSRWLNGTFPWSKCSIKAPDKYSVYVLIETYHQICKWLGPKRMQFTHNKCRYFSTFQKWNFRKKYSNYFWNMYLCSHYIGHNYLLHWWQISGKT